MTPNIYALTGPHGTGKTTEVYRLAHELKKRVKGDVGLIRETARRCPLPIYRVGEVPTEEAQRWIFGEQMRLEIEESARHEVVVSDRTIVDCIAYSAVAGMRELTYGMVKLARLHMGIYKSIIFMGIAGNPFCVDDGERHQDARLRAELEQVLLNLYAELGVHVEREAPF